MVDSSVQAELIREVGAVSTPGSPSGAVIFGTAKSALESLLDSSQESTNGNAFTIADVLSPPPTVAINDMGVASLRWNPLARALDPSVSSGADSPTNATANPIDSRFVIRAVR